MPRSRSMSLESIARSADLLAGAEGAGLLQQLVDQRGLAVVDVGDDGDVAQVHDVLRGGVRLPGQGAGTGVAVRIVGRRQKGQSRRGVRLRNVR